MEKNTVSLTIQSMDKMLMKASLAVLKAEMGDEAMIPMLSWVILYLYNNQSREVYQKDVERDFHVARSTVTNLVQQLEKGGYIERVSCERDCRLKRLELTQKGIEYHALVENVIRKIELAMRQGITVEDLDTYFRVTNQIRGNLSHILKDSHECCF